MNSTHFKKTLTLSLIAELLSFLSYAAIEPALSIAASAEDQIQINQSVTSGISITSPSDITLTALSVSQNTAVASTTWTVTTNNATGYSLTVKASSSPAMQKSSGASGSFANYSGVLTPWTVASGNFQFGFSAIGANTTGYGSDTENNCAAGTDVQSTTLGWKPLLTSATEIASSTATTTTSGVTTTFCVGTQQNGVFAPSGTYVATTTATATTNP